MWSYGVKVKIWNDEMWNDRYFVISNIKRKKDKLFNNFVFELFFYFLEII